MVKASPKKQVATPPTVATSVATPATSASPATPATPKVAKKEEVKEPVFVKVDDEIMMTNEPPSTYGREDYNKKLAERLSVFPSRKLTKPDGSEFLWGTFTSFKSNLKGSKPPVGRDLYVDPMSITKQKALFNELCEEITEKVTKTSTEGWDTLNYEMEEMPDSAVDSFNPRGCYETMVLLQVAKMCNAVINHTEPEDRSFHIEASIDFAEATDGCVKYGRKLKSKYLDHTDMGWFKAVYGLANIGSHWIMLCYSTSSE